MKMTTTGTENRTHWGFDVLIVPNRGLWIAAPHMTDEDVVAAREAWAAHGAGDVPPGVPCWTVALCNPDADGAGRVHATFRVPQALSAAA